MSLQAKLFGGAILIWLSVVSSGIAQNSSPTEYQIKAAFLFNFAKFVEWPTAAFADDKAPIVFGVLGENPFHEDLEDALKGKTLKNRPLLTKQLSSVKEVVNCHILFISASEKKRLPEILNSLHGATVLTVGEMDKFTESGGMINFLTEGTKVRFQINETAAKSAGLKISSKMLSLASRPGH